MSRNRFFTRIVFIGGVLIFLSSYKAIADEVEKDKTAGNIFIPPAGCFFKSTYISPFVDSSLGTINFDYSLMQDTSSVTLNLDVSIAESSLAPGLEFIPLASGSVGEYLQNVDVFMDRYNKVFLPSVYNIPAYRAELAEVNDDYMKYMKLVLYKQSYPARFFSEAVSPNLSEEEKSIIIAWQDVENIAREAWLDKKSFDGIIDTIAERYPEENLLQNDSLGSVKSGIWSIFIKQSKDSQYLFNVQISDEDDDGICESLMLFLYKRPPGKDHNQLVGSKKISYYPPVGSQCRYKIEELYKDFNGGVLDQVFKVESEVEQIGYNYKYDEEYYMKNSKGEYVSVGNFVISHLERVENDRMSAEVSYYEPESEGVSPDSGLDLGSLSFGSLLEIVIQTPSYTIGR